MSLYSQNAASHVTLEPPLACARTVGAIARTTARMGRAAKESIVTARSYEGRVLTQRAKRARRDAHPERASRVGAF